MLERQVILPTSPAGVSDDENALVNHLLAQLNAKHPRNFLRASYYDGKRAIRQVGSIIPPQYFRLGIVLGWSAKAVDHLARRINLDTFIWPDGDLNSLGYGELAEANLLHSVVNSGVNSSLIHGTSFLVNTTGDSSLGEPESLIHVKDAFNATGDWNARRRGLNNLLSITGRDEEGDVTSFALYLYNRTITAELANSKWQVSLKAHSWGMPAEPMVYKPTDARPFGYSRISRAIMSHHDHGLRTLIRLEAHMDVYSFPEMWLLGADESIFKNPDGTQKAAWQVMLGRVKAIPDNDDAPVGQERAEVKQFAASSPAPHLSDLNAAAKMFAREASLPDTAVAITDMANPTSADAYDASQQELVAEAEGACDDYRPGLRRTQVRALAMANGLKGAEQIPASWSSISPKMRNPRFLSRAAQADAGSKQLGAVEWLKDTEVGLELLGLDDQQIQRALAEKRRQQGTALVDRLLAARNGGSGVDDAASNGATP